MPHSFFTWWMSEWQTPQASTSISTLPGFGSSRSKWKGFRQLKECLAA
nr:hypothetical protein [uncultured Lichenicoccus sp.]